jgi:hypothetical protein
VESAESLGVPINVQNAASRVPDFAEYFKRGKCKLSEVNKKWSIPWRDGDGETPQIFGKHQPKNAHFNRFAR